MHVETRWRSQRECLQAASAEQHLEAKYRALMPGNRGVGTTILPAWTAASATAWRGRFCAFVQRQRNGDGLVEGPFGSKTKLFKQAKGG